LTRTQKEHKNSAKQGLDKLYWLNSFHAFSTYE